MRTRWTRGAPGLLLLALAGWPLLDASGAAPGVSEPLALALAPLGPIRALISSALWVDLLHGQTDTDSDRVTVIARALIEVHPGLAVVREYLANQLIVTEARRAPDRARHDVLVEAGLRMFEDGLRTGDSPRLRSGLAWTLAEQARIDARFAVVALRHFGETAEDEAIELLEDSADPADARLRGQLLAERGMSALIGTGDERAARRDLHAAERALAALAASDPEDAHDLLAPLRDALEQPADEWRAQRPPPRPHSPDDDP